MTQNSKVNLEAVPVEVGITATSADFEELIKATPGLQLLLVNIIQKRLLVEKDAEIAMLRNPEMVE